MSSNSKAPTANDRTDWTDLTPARRRVIKAVAHVNGPGEFERPDLLEEVKASSSVKQVIDDKDRVVTSLNYTTLLNELSEDDYLVKTFQGGTNPIVVDIYYDKNRDQVSAAPFGDQSKLMTMARQILDRNKRSGACLKGINTGDFNVVINTVNGVVSGDPMRVSSDASKYRFTVSEDRPVLE